MEKSKKLRELLLDNIDFFKYSGGAGTTPPGPDTEFFAFDHLGKAEQLLVSFTDARAEPLIECAAEISFAVDCQLDTFLYAGNLLETVAKHGFKLKDKLEFIHSVGVFDYRLLQRLTSYRDRIEKEIQNPKIEDIEIYFDIATVFVSTLQSAIIALLSREVSFQTYLYHDFESTLTSTYDKEEIKVEFTWFDSDHSKQTLAATFAEMNVFCYFLKSHILLNQKTFNNLEYIKRKLSIVS